MAAIDVVNRVLREFKRYTGDGLPGEPVNAPLPVGDPQSGVWNPKKVHLREALLAPVTAAEQSAIAAANSATDAEADANRADAAADVASAVMTTVLDPQFATKAAAEAYSPAEAPDYIRTAYFDSDWVDGSGGVFGNPTTVEPDVPVAAKLKLTLADGVTEYWYTLSKVGLNFTQFGAKPGTNSTEGPDIAQAWYDCLKYASGGSMFVPQGYWYTSKVGWLSSGGFIIQGLSKWKAVIRPHSDMLDGEAILFHELRDVGSSGNGLISDINFELRGRDVIGVDLTNMSNTVVARCRFTGGASRAEAAGVGVKFGTILHSGSYSNLGFGNTMTYLAKGYEWGEGANFNSVMGGECIGCEIGCDSAPEAIGDTVDTPRIYDIRMEGCGIGWNDKSHYAFVSGCRWEANGSDIRFINDGVARSDYPHVVGGLTASSGLVIEGIENANSPKIDNSDLGDWNVETSLSRVKRLQGKTVHTSPGVDLTSIAPLLPGGAWSDYFHNGLFIQNGVFLQWRNNDNTAFVNALRVTGVSNNIEYGSNLIPAADNAVTLGSGPRRPIYVYAVNGTLNTSDLREKEQIVDLDEAERRVAMACKLLIKKFKWRSDVSAKGNEAQWHFGVVAQEVIAAFAAEGLDWTRYGVVQHDVWDAEGDTPAGDRYGVSYTELLAFILAAA